MTTLRLWDRGGARRLAGVDAYSFPTAVRQRFALSHPGLDRAHLEAVEAAIRQWFRLSARQPRAKLAMPSAAAGDYWREFRLHTTEYGTFCAQTAGRLLQDGAADDRGARLSTTFRLGVAPHRPARWLQSAPRAAAAACPAAGDANGPGLRRDRARHERSVSSRSSPASGR